VQLMPLPAAQPETAAPATGAPSAGAAAKPAPTAAAGSQAAATTAAGQPGSWRLQTRKTQAVLLELQTLAGGRAEQCRRASLAGKLLTELHASLGAAAGDGGCAKAAMTFGQELAVGGCL
jgi:hypothetical protein